MEKYLSWFLIACLCSCGELTREYYYVNSPEDDAGLTFVRIKWLFEPVDETDKLERGIYLFYGQVGREDPFPDRYLKIKYSDYSPIGIIWGDTIRVRYKYIEKIQLIPRTRLSYTTTQDLLGLTWPNPHIRIEMITEKRHTILTKYLEIIE